MYRFLFKALLFSVWCLAEMELPQTVELDLVFPRENETYAPMAFFPFVWSVQNAAAGLPDGFGVYWYLYPNSSLDWTLSGYKSTPSPYVTSSEGDADVPDHIMHNTTASPFLFIDSLQYMQNSTTKWLLGWEISFVGNCSLNSPIPKRWSSGLIYIQFEIALGGKLPDILTEPATCPTNPLTFEVQGTMSNMYVNLPQCLILSPEDKFPLGNPCAFEVDEAVAASVTAEMMQSASCTMPSGSTPTGIWPNITGICKNSSSTGIYTRLDQSAIFISVAVAIGTTAAWGFVW